ncbi:hypothetical protein EVAR_6011_1 [Eumeta japonica]|uniref:Uncharacterized protein n=1 Tax=Eumeta variegata TaxID=151549 RepID=A0A4C1TAM4_EUMVA|nr:hypothetical protein EVAR_6011_1 [Eumeta japonica]
MCARARASLSVSIWRACVRACVAPSVMDTRKTRGIINAFPPSWVRGRYLMEGEMDRWSSAYADAVSDYLCPCVYARTPLSLSLPLAYMCACVVPSAMDTRKTRGIISAFSPSWVRVRYLMD